MLFGCLQRRPSSLLFFLSFSLNNSCCFVVDNYTIIRFMMPAVLRFLPMLSAPYPARSIAAAASHHHTVKRRVHPPFGGIYCVHCGAGRCGCQLRPVVSSGQILRLIVIMRNIEHPRQFCGRFRKRTTFLGLRILRNCGYGAWCVCLVTIASARMPMV